MRMAMAGLFFVATVLPACGVLPVPGLGPRGGEGMAELVENRLWLAAEPEIPGSMRVFLGGGELLLASCWEVPRVARWRWTGTARLEWTDPDGRTSAEVVTVGPSELVLLEDGAGTVRFRAGGARPLC